MKKIYKNSIFVIIGIVIGLLLAFVIFKSFEGKNKDEEKVIVTEPVDYFKSVEKSNDENTLKSGFIKVVDFLFYDGELGGVKFNELKDDTKLELMKIFYSIDDKINSYYPDYKEIISRKTGKIYDIAKEKVTELYVKTINKICESNTEFCENARDGFNKISEKFSITFDYLKDFSKEELNKLKEWYIKFKNS